ncbi:hypothetical protein VNO80_24913 [Phaseolus coccineus]|uniref:Uncharacterized protein n=1 Tax=Phaseolus coccineus TaxID=3886 RepID=A0AAN9QNH2_PHACN
MFSVKNGSLVISTAEAFLVEISDDMSRSCLYTAPCSDLSNDILKVDFFKLGSLAREMEEKRARYNCPSIGVMPTGKRDISICFVSFSLIGHRHLVSNKNWYFLKDRNK